MRIVTFGNSLTLGFQSPTPENPLGEPTPYGLFLQERIGENLRKNRRKKQVSEGVFKIKLNNWMKKTGIT